MQFRELLGDIYSEYGTGLFALLYFAFWTTGGHGLSCKWTRIGRAGGPMDVRPWKRNKPWKEEGLSKPPASPSLALFHGYHLPFQLSNVPKCDKRREHLNLQWHLSNLWKLGWVWLKVEFFKQYIFIWSFQCLNCY